MRQAINFSKDLITGLWDKAGQQKDQLVSGLSREFVKFLQQINIADEMQKILDGMTLDVQARIDFSRKKTTLNFDLARKKAKSNRKRRKNSD